MRRLAAVLALAMIAPAGLRWLVGEEMFVSEDLLRVFVNNGWANGNQIRDMATQCLLCNELESIVREQGGAVFQEILRKFDAARAA
jgi:hypothetical protein